MKLKNAFLCSLLIFFAIPSQSSSLKNFCKTAYSDRLFSKQSIQSDGYIIKRVKDPGAKRPKNKRFYYRGCRYDVKWMEESYAAVCEKGKVKKQSLEQRKRLLSNVTLPENVFFFFDGAADFHADQAYYHLRPENLDGSEGRDMGAGNGNGLTALKAMKYSNHSFGRNRKLTQFQYHASSGLHQRENYDSAKGCAMQISQYLKLHKSMDERRAMPKLSVMGFSNGGALAIDFQHDLASMGLPADLVFSVDPIVQAIAYPFHVKDTIGKRNRKTKKFVNVYQRTDYGSLPGFELRGKPVKGADVNIHMTYESFPRQLTSSGRQNHLYIIRSSLVRDILNCELSSLLEGEAECVYDQVPGFML